jgi:hypothetical protein
MSTENPLHRSAARVALIRERHAMINALPPVGVVLPVTKTELKSEANAIVSLAKSDDEIRDEEIVGFAPTIPEERASAAVESETDILLTARERAELRRDLPARVGAVTVEDDTLTPEESAEIARKNEMILSEID